LLTEEARHRFVTLRAGASRLIAEADGLASLRSELARMAGLDETAWYGTPKPEECLFTTVRDKALKAIAAKEALPSWLDYIKSRRLVREFGFDPVINLAESRHLSTRDVEAAFELTFFSSLLGEVFRAYPVLVEFDGMSHTQIKDRFVKLDLEIGTLNRQR